MKPKHVLIPLNFSEPSLRALEFGLCLADRFSAEVTLVHVVVLPAEESLASETESKLLSLLPERFRERCRFHVPLVDCGVEEELLRAVRETSADLVVLGTRGLRPFRRLFRRSLTKELLRVMPVPLIAVSQGDGEAGREYSAVSAMDRVLYAADLAEPIEETLPTALDFARSFGAELEIAHVGQEWWKAMHDVEGPVDAGSRLPGRELIEQIVSSAEASGVAISSTPLQGDPLEAVLAHIVKRQVDLVVMSLPGRALLKRAWEGAAAERVVRAVTPPVLAIPVD